MLRLHCMLLTVGALALAACNSESMTTAPIGTPGAGLTVKILSVTPDSIGYKVSAQVTNADTAQIGIGTCTFDDYVEALRNGAWTNVTPGGSCDLVEYGLQPGQNFPILLRNQRAVGGDEIRLTVDWKLHVTGGAGSSTSAPSAVQ